MDFFNENKKLIIILAVVFVIVIVSLSVGILFLLKSKQNNDETESKEDRYLKRYVDFSPKLKIEKSAIDRYIEELSGEKYQGRKAGTKGEAEAALFLARELKELGYQPFWQNNYFQKFSVPEMVPVQSGRRYHLQPVTDERVLTADNVAGFIKREDTAEYIIISAHYDHLGILNGDRPRMFSGANRNASGVAAALEIARVISENADAFNYNIVVAFWSGHEAGLLGSEFFAEQLSAAQVRNIKFIVNLDTIGSFGSQDFIILKENYRPNFFINEALEWGKISIVERNHDQYLADHYHFAVRNVPAVTIMSENWMQGTASFNDTRFGVNTESIRNLAQHIINYLYWLEGE